MKKIYNIIRKYFYYFILYSFIGWIYECLWFLINKSKAINRGFLYGPNLPIYGIGGLILLLIFRNIKRKKRKSYGLDLNFIFIFCLIFILATGVEYIGHYILDTFFNIKLWNYSNQPLNINGRVCFESSKNFAIGGTLLFYFIQPFLDTIYRKLNKNEKNIFFVVTFVIFIVDFLITVFL